MQRLAVTLVVTPLLLLAAASAADAQLLLGAEGQVGVASEGWAQESQLGQGVQLRLGYALPAPGLHLVGEATGGHLAFDPTSAQNSLEINNLGAGLRVGIDAPLRPSVFGHLGYAWVTAPGLPDVEDGQTWDVGAALDLTLLPVVNIGVSTAWHNMPGQGQWVTAGAHLEVAF